MATQSVETLVCEVCGVNPADYIDHYEEHIDPPRRINICQGCHLHLPDHKWPGRGLTEQLCIKIHKGDLNWLTGQVRVGRFASVSHGVRYALKEFMRGDKEK